MVSHDMDNFMFFYASVKYKIKKYFPKRNTHGVTPLLKEAGYSREKLISEVNWQHHQLTVCGVL
jgi:hypothetical protein